MNQQWLYIGTCMSVFFLSFFDLLYAALQDAKSHGKHLILLRSAACCVSRVPPWGNSAKWSRTSSSSRFYDHIQTHHIRQVFSGRAQSKDPCLTTHNTYRRQTPMIPAGFETAIPSGGRPQTHALDRAATGIGCRKLYLTKGCNAWAREAVCAFPTLLVLISEQQDKFRQAPSPVPPPFATISTWHQQCSSLPNYHTQQLHLVPCISLYCIVTWANPTESLFAWWDAVRKRCITSAL